MARRDFSVSNKEYIKKNKFALIGVSVFLLISLIVIAVFGFNGNFEVKGHYQFEVSIGNASASKYASKIGTIINSYGGKYENYQIENEGESSTLVVRYMKQLSNSDQKEINEKVEALSSGDVTLTVMYLNGSETGHVKVGSSITSKDYVYTAVTILIVMVVATIFVYARYNGASAITLLLCCLLATLGYLCITALLRITVGQSYFCLLIMLNLLVVYGCINFFENIKETSWLQSNQYAQALDDGMKRSHFKFCVLSVAIFAIGLLFALIAPESLKFISLGILFLSVTLLAVLLYVLPFVWSMLITCRKIKKANVTK